MKIIKTSNHQNKIRKISAEMAKQYDASEFEPEELAEAIASEMEQTYSRAIARERAVAHLSEKKAGNQ